MMDRPVEYIEHHKGCVSIYYVGQVICNSKVAKIVNTSLPWPDEQSAILLDENGEKIMTIRGGEIINKYDRSKLETALKHVREQPVDFGTGQVSILDILEPKQSTRHYMDWKERMGVE